MERGAEPGQKRSGHGQVRQKRRLLQLTKPPERRDNYVIGECRKRECQDKYNKRHRAHYHLVMPYLCAARPAHVGQWHKAGEGVRVRPL